MYKNFWKKINNSTLVKERLCIELIKNPEIKI